MSRSGEGVSGVQPPVCQKRPGCPDMDVRTSSFEPVFYALSPLSAFESSFISYKGIQGAFEEP